MIEYKRPYVYIKYKDMNIVCNIDNVIEVVESLKSSISMKNLV